MRCREMVELMTEYLEGALGPADRARFEEHIAGCDGCRGYLEQMRITMRTVGRLAEEDIQEPFQSELLKAFRDWRSAGD